MGVRARRGAGLRRATRGRAGFVGLAFGLYALAAVVATWPAVKDARTRFLAGGAPGHGEASAGDHLQTGYHLWLAGHQLGEGRAPWLDPYSFAGTGETIWNPAAWPFGLLYWPLEAAFGQVGGWNLFVLLTHVLAGALACLWLRELGLPRGAALAGGLAFALGPYRVNQSVGHLLGPIAVLLPLALYGVERARRGSAWWLALAGASIASIPFSGQVHLALGAVPLFAAYAALRLRGGLLLGAAAACVVAAAGAGLLVRQGVIAGSTGSRGRSLEEVDVYSAELLDFLVRHERHGPESFVFLGWATPLLALAGLVLLVRAGRTGLAALLGLAALVPILLAFGTNLPLYEPLWHALPPLRFPRVPERLMPIAVLAIAALVGFLAARLPRTAAVTALLLALLFVDLRVRAYGRSAADQGNAAYAAVRAAPDGRLLELPVFRPDVHFGSVYLYYDTQARRERPFGYSTTAPPAALRHAVALERLNCGDWSGGAARLLRELDVAAITLHTALFEHNKVVHQPAWFAWRGLTRNGWTATPGGPVVRTFERVRGSSAGGPAEPSRARPHFCQGWSPRGPGWVMTAERASFWAYGSRVVYAARAPVSAFVAGPTFVDGRRARLSVTAAARVRVPLGKLDWHLVTLTVPKLASLNGREVGLRLVSVDPRPRRIAP